MSGSGKYYIKVDDPNSDKYYMFSLMCESYILPCAHEHTHTYTWV